MVVAVVEDQPVGVVDPVARGAQMHGRKVGVSRRRGHTGPFLGCVKHTGKKRGGETRCVARARARVQPFTPVDAMLFTNDRWNATNRARIGTVIMEE
ncbi:hypothetical protein GCM10010103_77210 [Streptomyces paradoxus]